MKTIPPIHPGEILLEEFITPLKISQYRLAKELNVSPRRINEIIHEKRGITTDTALRLAKFFKTSPFFWIHLQAKYEISKNDNTAQIDKILPSLKISHS
jgi:addiction module HigA family antidote